MITIALSLLIKAASYLLNYQIKVDWSQRDTKLFTTIFSGHRPATCKFCSSFLHTSDFCIHAQSTSGKFITGNSRIGQRSSNKFDNRGRPRIQFEGREICNLYNGPGGCYRRQCSFAHICLKCRQPHSAHLCTLQSTSKAPETAGMPPRVSAQPAMPKVPSQGKNKA